MEIRMHVNKDVSNWMLQVIFPDEAVDTYVLDVYNAGVPQCSATIPTRHAMIAPASWANNLKAGEEVFMEIRATNTNMNNDFIKNNVQFKMFKK